MLDCGFGTGAWIERLLDEFRGDIDVSTSSSYSAHRSPFRVHGVLVLNRSVTTLAPSKRDQSD